MASRESRAWAAGFFDGEGCFMAQVANTRNRTVYLRATVTQNERPLLDRFQGAVGDVGTVRAYAGRPQSPAGHRFQTTGRGAFAVADALWPWLGERKKADFKRTVHLVYQSRKDLQRPQRSDRQRREARQLHREGTTCTEVARALSVPKPTVHRWLKGGD